MESQMNQGQANSGDEASSEELSEDEVKFEDTPVAEVHHPKDPRSKAKYNIFSRLLFWYI